jgi:formate C-acetyltransferase
MHNNLANYDNFDDFYKGFCKLVSDTVDSMIVDVHKNHENIAKNRPNPIRTLFTDDCIDRELDFTNGGARINGAMTAESGMINTIDSLLAIRELVFETKRYSAEEFLRLLTNEDEYFYKELENCLCFGVDDSAADDLANDFSKMFYSCFIGKKSYRGGPVIPTSHQHTRYTYEGCRVGPTPDGGRNGEPLCDSLAPLSGKNKKGPTAAIKSSCRLALDKVYGIPVVNVTLGIQYVGEPLKGIIKGFMSMNGVMMQITVVSKEELIDAMDNPDKYEDLVVRVGGYTDYFNRLTPDLKQAIIERTIYE